MLPSLKTLIPLVLAILAGTALTVGAYVESRDPEPTAAPSEKRVAPEAARVECSPKPTCTDGRTGDEISMRGCFMQRKV